MLKTTLSKLLQPEQALNENPLAKALYKLLERKDFKVEGDPEKEEEVLNWMGDILTLSLTDKCIPPLPKGDVAVAECLFKSISIKGVKKIPRLDSNMRLSFCTKDGKPISTIIMGENGVGKTSFYGSLEYIGMGEMKTAQIYDQKKEDYIKNIFTGKTDISALLKTTKEDLSLDISNPKANCFPAFFISEWDIRELEKMPDFGSFIFSQLGIKNFSNLLSFLISVKDRLTVNLASYNILKGEISSLRMKVEAFKFIIERKPTYTDEQLISLLGRASIVFPSLFENESLVENYEELIEQYKNEIKEDNVYHHYNNSVEDLYLNSVKVSIDMLEKRLEDYNANKSLFTTTRLKEAISKCQQSSSEYLHFKTSLKGLVEEILKSENLTLSFLIEQGFEKMGNLADKKNEWDHTMMYSMLKEAQDPQSTNTFLNQTIEALQTEFNKMVKDIIDRILQPILEKLLQDYLDKELEEVKLSFNEDERSISAKLVIRRQPESSMVAVSKNPIEYFNTFRFKMFAVSLKIALACCAKSIYNINWPIVIDDVFNSSDFSNRSRMGDYIDRICEEYDQLPKVGDMDLQLIFFTQDDVIGDAIYKGLISKSKSAQLVRLYDYRCFDKEKINSPDNDIPHIEVGVEVDSRHF